VGWGAAAGLAGVVGTSLLYQGLAIGRISVVAEPEGGLPLALRGVEKFLTPLNAWSAEQKWDVGTLPSPPASRRPPPSSRRRDRAGYSPVLLLALPALGGSKRTTAGILW
jgi:hypothetical protein